MTVRPKNDQLLHGLWIGVLDRINELAAPEVRIPFVQGDSKLDIQRKVLAVLEQS
jgi:hypothetical protein